MSIKKYVPRNMRGKLMYGLKFLPDSIYVSLFYWAATGRYLNLKNPETYNEKLNWLKIHGNYAQYSHLADKLAVRNHVESVLGPGYLFPLLKAWRSADEIDFDCLPNEFVMKCNHDSGSVKIILDKASLSAEQINDIREYYKKRLSEDFFYAGREYSYKYITPFVIVEKLMYPEGGTTDGINDYKFFCFNGEPKLLLLCSGRDTEKHFHYEDYFDMDWNRLPIRNGWTESPVCPPKPACFEELKMMAAKLSKGIPQVRMDFYEIDGKPYFGEYTFFNGGGFELFQPEEWEKKLGSWIDLNNLN